MSRKDYLLIAEAIAKARTHIMWSDTLVTAQQGVDITASYLAELLADDNPAFNAERFLSACGVDES